MPAASWTRHVADAFTEHLGYKAAALFFAVALWAAASGDETAARRVPVQFQPVLDSSMRVVGPLPTVEALVSGPTRELLELYSTPPTIRRALGSRADTATLELRPGDVDLPTNVEDVSVRDVQPRVVVLHLTRAHP